MKKFLFSVILLGFCIMAYSQNIKSKLEYIKLSIIHNYNYSEASSNVIFGVSIDNKSIDTVALYFPYSEDTSYVSIKIKIENKLGFERYLCYKLVDHITKLLILAPKEKASFELHGIEILPYVSLSYYSQQWSNWLENIRLMYVPNQSLGLYLNEKGYSNIIIEPFDFKISEEFYFKYYIDLNEINPSDSINMRKVLPNPFR